VQIDNGVSIFNG